MRASSLFVVIAACGCGPPAPGPVRTEQERIIYGDDDRRDYFDTPDRGIQELIERSTVALVPNGWLDRVHGTLSPDAPSWGELNVACPDQRLAFEPGVAFCTGVLVDWDLVLTAGHCLRVLSLEDFTVLFDYYYVADQTFALTRASMASPARILAEALDPASTMPRQDYGWIRLSRPAPASRLPVPVYRRTPALARGDPFITIGSPGGAPLKVDAAAVLDDPRDGRDYFLARADDSGGWSGGGAFDTTLALFGILSRGGTDIVASDECGIEQQVRDSVPAQEAFLYVAPTLDALCQLEPARTVCRSDCEEPCQALPPALPMRSDPDDAACTLCRGRAGRNPMGPVALAMVLLIASRRRRRSNGARGLCRVVE